MSSEGLRNVSLCISIASTKSSTNLHLFSWTSLWLFSMVWRFHRNPNWNRYISKMVLRNWSTPEPFVIFFPQNNNCIFVNGTIICKWCIGSIHRKYSSRVRSLNPDFSLIFIRCTLVTLLTRAGTRPSKGIGIWFSTNFMLYDHTTSRKDCLCQSRIVSSLWLSTSKLLCTLTPTARTWRPLVPRSVVHVGSCSLWMTWMQQTFVSVLPFSLSTS